MEAAATGRGWTSARITHIAMRDAWNAASIASTYEAPSLEAEGFVHCSTPWQVVRIANTNFAGRRDLVLLVIDPRRLGAEVVFENCEGGHEPFPHVYGPIEVAAVVDVVPLEWDEAAGSFSFPPGYELGRSS